jgi:hypothetical protein
VCIDRRRFEIAGLDNTVIGYGLGDQSSIPVKVMFFSDTAAR